MSTAEPITLAAAGLRGVPDVMGGIETHCQHLYPGLLRAIPGLQVRLYARSPYVKSGPYEYQGVEVWPLPAVRARGAEALLHTLLAVLHACVVRRPSLLHLHAIGPALFVPLARAAGLRVVCTHHGRDYRRAKWGPFAKWALRAGEGAMVRFSHQVICVSDDDAESLRARFPARRDRIHAIPNGVDLPPQSPQGDAVLSELGLDPMGYVLAVGRLVPEKGFHELIAAHRRSPGGRRLVIVGAADHEDRYSRDLLASAGPDVVFAGRRQKGELRSLYENAALFVLPSHHEGLPLVALEAMFCRTRCLLSDIPANRQLQLPAAAYFPPGDVAGLAAKLGQPLEGLARPEPSMLQRYRWSGVATATAEVLKRALA